MDETIEEMIEGLEHAAMRDDIQFTVRYRADLRCYVARAERAGRASSAGATGHSMLGAMARAHGMLNAMEQG